MILGWGSSSTTIAIPNNTTQSIVTTFSYFHLIFILRLTFNRRWLLVENKTLDNSGTVTTTQKPLTKAEVDKILGNNPVNIFWSIFNQSLLWFILASILFAGFGNFSRTWNPTVAPNKTVAEIIKSKYWNAAEEKLVVENATDAEFEQFLTKFRNEANLLKAIKARQIFLSKTSSSPISSTNTTSSVESTVSSSSQN
jgi:hypothetical protein